MALTVASELPSTLESVVPAGLVTLDFRNPERAAAQAQAFASATPLAGVVGVDDDTAVLAALIAEALGLKGNAPPAAEAARDKHRQREMLAAAGVPVPAFTLHEIGEDPEALGRRVHYPCVVKPLRLSASRGVIRTDDLAGFVGAVRRLTAILQQPDVAACGEPARRFLVEDYVPGAEVALEGLLRGGRLNVLALFDKPDPLEGPFFEETIYVTPSRLPAAAQGAIRQAAQAATQALGLHEGPIHAELRVNERGSWVIELAARPIGGRCSAVLRFVGTGKGEGGWVSLEELIVRHALGMELPSLEREADAAGVMMIPTPRAGVLREVRGQPAARAVPLVEEVSVTVPPGQRLVPLPEGSRYLGFIFARGASPPAVEAALREAHGRLDVVID